jgi:nucleoid-associated protein YgaU
MRVEIFAKHVTNRRARGKFLVAKLLEAEIPRPFADRKKKDRSRRLRNRSVILLRGQRMESETAQLSRGTKIVLALGVLTLGLFGALLYRHPSPAPTPAPPSETGQLALRQWRDPAELPAPPAVRATEIPPVEIEEPDLREALDAPKPPPTLSPDYPQVDVPSGRPAGPPMVALPQPLDSKPALRIHKVADGDTLVLLARRYLGDASRAGEILALNRDVITPPDALPIGKELKIPPDPRLERQTPLMPIDR